MMNEPGVPPRSSQLARWRTRHTRLIVGTAVLAATLALTGCSQSAPPQAKKVAAGALPSEHVHGISRDPGSGKVNLATHQGLFVLQPDASWQRVGPEVDLMGFAVSGPGTFYASGHPAAGVDLPAPVGLIKSTDAGATWTVLSRGGKSDFHALTASSTSVTGFDGVLRTTLDGKAWSKGGLTAEPRTLAAAPDGSQVLATTKQGLLSSTDGGRTWGPLASAPSLFLVAWADSKAVVGVTTKGGIAISADAGRTWRTALATVTSGQALSASRDKAGRLEILIVTDTGVLQSRDDGATLTTLGGTRASSGMPASEARNADDVEFSTMMIPHHAQAIAMADLALRQATNPRVKALAPKIKAAQGPEVERLSGWLTGWGEPVPGAAGGHDMPGMDAQAGGMMSAQEMTDLGKAKGSAFDRMWLEMMIRHHQGAVDVSRTELAQGANPESRKLAQSIIDSQSAEIAEMRSILAGTPER